MFPKWLWSLFPLVKWVVRQANQILAIEAYLLSQGPGDGNDGSKVGKADPYPATFHKSPIEPHFCHDFFLCFENQGQEITTWNAFSLFASLLLKLLEYQVESYENAAI